MNNTTTKNTQSAQLNAASSDAKFVSSFMALHMSALSFLQERSINLFNNTNPGENQTTRKPLLTLINMKNQTKKQILMSCLIALSSLFLANGAFAATFTSNSNGDWKTPATWGRTSGYPNSSSDNVTIASGTTVTISNSINDPSTITISNGGTLNINYAKTLNSALTINFGSKLYVNAATTFSDLSTIDGTIYIAAATIFDQSLTINGTYEETSVVGVTYKRSLNNNGTFTASTGNHIFTLSEGSTNRTIDGTILIPNLQVNSSNNKTFTNIGDLTISTALTGDGTLIQGASSTLTLGGTSTITGLNATTNTNTVTYNGSSSQSIDNVDYSTLALSGNATKTLAKNTTVATLTIASGATLNLNNYTLTVSGATNNAGTITGGTGAITFTGATTNAGTITGGTGAITFTGALTNSGTINGGAGVVSVNATSTNTGTGTLTIPSLTVGTGATLTNNGTTTVSTALAGLGTFTQGATGSLTLGGTFGITSLVASAAGNTVTYNGTSQTVRDITYSKLVLNGTSTTLPTFTAIPSTFEVAASKSYTSTANLTVNDFIINTGSTFTMGGSYTLTVKGNYTNNGTFTGNTANITFNGTAAQTISGSSSNDFKYMILNNTAGLTLSAKVNIFKVLTVTAGELKANSNLTIKSKDVTTSTGTAQVTQLPASGASITGNVTVERFIPAGLRSYRHLSCPVNSVSIFNSWQDSGANNAGYGVQITGPTANRANIGAGNAANGLDYTAASSYSMYTMTTSNVMSPVTNTKTTNFTPGLGYNIFIRGDRATNLYNTSVTTNTQTTLRATGLLNQGDVTISLCNGWNIIGNPYASTIAWNASGWSTARGANTGATVYILNPAVVSGTSNRFACHNGVVGTNGWPATGPYIESGQGFYVYTTAATSITFKEEYKTSNEAAIYFKNNSIADLLRIEYLSNGVHQDDIAINFRDGGKTILDLAVDAETMASATNGIASLKNASRLAINTRPVFETIDTVALSVMSTTTGKFSMKFTELASFSGMTQIILVDKFLNKMINVDQNVTYNFDITANPNSKGDNRFVMLFSKVGTAAFTTSLANATEEVSNVSLYPNPASSTINLACSNANVRDFSYEIYNQMGQSVSAGAGNFTNGNIEAVNIENLDKGIYFVKMFYNNNVEIIRFVK